MNKKHLMKSLNDLFDTQRFGVIATKGKEEPYTNLVAFVNTQDLKNIIFATSKNTRKFENIVNYSRVSMLIDNRDNKPSDIKRAISVTAIGSANEIKDNRTSFGRLYLEKHPYLSDFVNSSNCAMIRLEVEQYLVVNGFQNVEILSLKDKL